MNGFVGGRTPTNFADGGDIFLAINDGSAKIDLGISAAVLGPSLGVVIELTGIIRTRDDLASQTRINAAVPLNVVSGATFGPSVTLFSTMNGIDIGDAEFKAIAEQQGAPPFSLVKEEYLSLGAFVAVSITRSVSVDFSVQRKVLGRNSDISTSGAAGLGVSF